MCTNLVTWEIGTKTTDMITDICRFLKFTLFVFVFNPRWDMHLLRAKEIKDSSNSQADPKILVLLKNGTVRFHNGSG